MATLCDIPQTLRSFGESLCDERHVLESRDGFSGETRIRAYALLVYTGLQIFATMGAMKETGMKMLALFALVVLVGAIIPACRKFERRWRNLTDEQAADMSYESAFKRDLTMLWLLAIGLPFALTMLSKGIAALM